MVEIKIGWGWIAVFILWLADWSGIVALSWWQILAPAWVTFIAYISIAVFVRIVTRRERRS